MAFRIVDAYATVWQTTAYENFVGGNISTSRKDKRDDSYINSNWRVAFVGDAKAKAEKLQERDFIVIKSGQVEMSPRLKEKNQVVDENNYKVFDGNVTVFDFDLYSDVKQGEVKQVSKPKKEIDTDSELPF